MLVRLGVWFLTYAHREIVTGNIDADDVQDNIRESQHFQLFQFPRCTFPDWRAWSLLLYTIMLCPDSVHKSGYPRAPYRQDTVDTSLGLVLVDRSFFLPACQIQLVSAIYVDAYYAPKMTKHLSFTALLTVLRPMEPDILLSLEAVNSSTQRIATVNHIRFRPIGVDHHLFPLLGCIVWSAC